MSLARLASWRPRFMTTRRAKPPLDLRSPAAALVVVRAQLGDRMALDDLLRALEAPLWSQVRLVVRDDDLASDVLQDAMLTIARKLTALRDPRWLRAWAVRIAVRQAARAASRVGRHIHQPIDDLHDTLAAPVSEPAFDRELIDKVARLVSTLPVATQAVVRLRYLDGMSVVEIAEALEIPQGTVKSRLAYGLARLREQVTGTAFRGVKATLPE